jgi:hypothetical protein
MDIAGWLRSLGLEQYEPVFRENAINEKILPHGGSPEGHGHRASLGMPNAARRHRRFKDRLYCALYPCTSQPKELRRPSLRCASCHCWFLSLSRDYNPHGGYA